MNQNKGNVFLGMALHADVPATVNQILSLANIDYDDGESFPQDKTKCMEVQSFFKLHTGF